MVKKSLQQMSEELAETLNKFKTAEELDIFFYVTKTVREEEEKQKILDVLPDINNIFYN